VIFICLTDEEARQTLRGLEWLHEQYGDGDESDSVIERLKMIMDRHGVKYASINTMCPSCGHLFTAEGERND
jgi:hypothetical protein